MGIGICLLHCLLLVLIKSSRSCCSCWVPVYRVLASLWVWVVKPLVFIFLTFPDITGGQGGHESNEGELICVLYVLLRGFAVSCPRYCRSQSGAPRAPWCRQTPSALSVQITAVCSCRVSLDSAAPVFTKPLSRGRQIRLARAQHLLGGESLMQSRKGAVLTGCSECSEDVEKQSKPGNRHWNYRQPCLFRTAFCFTLWKWCKTMFWHHRDEISTSTDRAELIIAMGTRQKLDDSVPWAQSLLLHSLLPDRLNDVGTLTFQFCVLMQYVFFTCFCKLRCGYLWCMSSCHAMRAGIRDFKRLYFPWRYLEDV